MHGLFHWTGDEVVAFARATVDISVVAYAIYKFMVLAKGTRAWQIISGLLVFLVILALSHWAQLITLEWLLQQMFLLGPVAIVILFYPELRHALEEVGRLGFWGRNFAIIDKEDVTLVVGELVRAANSLSDKKIGALIVLERETGLTDIIETGTTVNAEVSSELLGTLFYPGSPLHDGAVIIRRDRVVAAGCTLPLSESREIGTMVHTRHKAALGMSEQSDALVIVVSEERGIVSVAFGGKMVSGLRDDALRDRLMQSYMGKERTTVKRRRSTNRLIGTPGLPPLSSFSPFRPSRTAGAATDGNDHSPGAPRHPAAHDGGENAEPGFEPSTTAGAGSTVQAARITVGPIVDEANPNGAGAHSDNPPALDGDAASADVKNEAPVTSGEGVTAMPLDR
ncbi:MAG: diadenylate cyclase CdaA [Capsulimonadaceae bacterium]